MVAASQDIVLSAGAAPGIAAGANVRTPLGPRRVENLRRGQLVVTRHGLQPVRIVWHRQVSQQEMGADPFLAPVRLARRAVGPMMPLRDVLLAGGQRVLVPACRVLRASDGRGRLVAARELAGLSDASFVDRGPETVTYVTLVFDCPEIIEVEGLQVESFQATAATISRLSESQRTDLLRAFPELARAPSSYPPVEYEAASGADLRPPALA